MQKDNVNTISGYLTSGSTPFTIKVTKTLWNCDPITYNVEYYGCKKQSTQVVKREKIHLRCLKLI